MLNFRIQNHFFTTLFFCVSGLVSNYASAEGFSLSSVTETGISHKNGNVGFTFALSGVGQYESPTSPWGMDFKYDLAVRPFASPHHFDGFDHARLEFSVYHNLGSGRLISRLGDLPAIAQTGVNTAAMRTGLSLGVEDFSNGFSAHVYSLASQSELSSGTVTVRDAIGLAHSADRVNAWDLNFEPVLGAVHLQLLGYSGKAIYGAHNISGSGSGWGAEIDAALWDNTVQLRFGLAQTEWTPIAMGQKSGRRNNLELTFTPINNAYSLNFEIDDIDQGFYSPLAPKLADGVLSVSADIMFSRPDFDFSFGVSRRRKAGIADITVVHEILTDLRYSPPGAGGRLSLTGQLLLQRHDRTIPTPGMVIHQTSENMLGAFGVEYTGNTWDLGMELGLIRNETPNATHSTETFMNAFVSYSNDGNIEFDLETSLTRQEDMFDLGWDREVSFELRSDQISTCCSLALSGRYIDFEDVTKTNLLVGELNLTRLLSPSSELVLFARHGKGDTYNLAGNIEGTQIGFSIRKTIFIAL